MLWGPAQWLKELPYSNAAYSYDFEHGESGQLTLEFWITPFDYAGAEGPQRAVPSQLKESQLIGLSWAVIDYGNGSEKGSSGFWNLSRTHTMYGQASQLVAFRLMPLERSNQAPPVAKWSHDIIDRTRRLVAFTDQSLGPITHWEWDFGDGETSKEANPVHQYKSVGKYVVVLRVQGPTGESKLSKVWDVAF